MIKYNSSILKELESSNLENVYESPVWFLKVEKIFHKGSFYLKTYVFKNISDIKINEICFKVSYNDKEIIQKISEISRAETYLNDPVYGCLVKLPEDYDDSKYDILIQSLVIDSKLIDYTKAKRGLLDFNSKQFDDNKNVFLRKNLDNYLVLPTINKEYWMCSCGKYNFLNMDNCANCGNTLDYMQTLANKGQDNEVLEQYLNTNPIIFDSKKPFEEVLTAYLAALNDKFGFKDEYILTKLDAEAERHHYEKQLATFNKDQEEKAIALKKKQKKTLKYGLIALIVFLTGMYVVNYGSETVTYASGLIKLWSGNYEEAVTEFDSIKSFANAQSMVYESNLKWSISVFENDPEAAIALLEEIPERNHGDAKTKYDEFVYSHAQSLFDAKKYQAAADYFVRIDYKDSVNQYNESYYLLAKSYYANPTEYTSAIKAIKVVSQANYKDSVALFNEWQYLKVKEYLTDKKYTIAINILEGLGSYKDSTQLLQDSRYLEGVRLMGQKNYANAITYFLKAGNYKDAQTKIKECNYQIAASYQSKKDYTNALAYFNKIKGYRDANSRIYSIEEIIYAWNVEIYFNTSENSTSDYSSLSGSSTLYVHFKLSGGKPNERINIKYVYTFPNGYSSSSFTTWEMGDGDDNWFSWTEGPYDYPSPVGNLKISLYNASNGKFIGSDSVYLTR